MIRFLINIYIIILIVDAVVSYVPDLKRFPAIQWINKIADYSLKHVRKHMPSDLPFDPSPLIVILALNLLVVIW